MAYVHELLALRVECARLRQLTAAGVAPSASPVVAGVGATAAAESAQAAARDPGATPASAGVLEYTASAPLRGYLMKKAGSSVSITKGGGKRNWKKRWSVAGCVCVARGGGGHGTADFGNKESAWQCVLRR